MPVLVVFVEVLVRVVDLLVGHPAGALPKMKRESAKSGSSSRHVHVRQSNDSPQTNDRSTNDPDLNPTARRRLGSSTDQSPSAEVGRLPAYRRHRLTKSTSRVSQSEICCEVARGKKWRIDPRILSWDLDRTPFL